MSNEQMGNGTNFNRDGEKLEMQEMLSIVEAMKRVGTSMLSGSLDEAQRMKEADPSAGIFIAKLDVPPMMCGGQEYSFYGARVLSATADGKQPYVTPHMHMIGQEPYYFAANGGEMNIGKVNKESSAIEWNPPQTVRVGDTILVEEGEVHSFRNTGTDPVDFVFACPNNHLKDRNAENPEGDRYTVSTMTNSVPAHYPTQK